MYIKLQIPSRGYTCTSNYMCSLLPTNSWSWIIWSFGLLVISNFKFKSLSYIIYIIHTDKCYWEYIIKRVLLPIPLCNSRWNSSWPFTTSGIVWNVIACNRAKGHELVQQLLHRGIGSRTPSLPLYYITLLMLPISGRFC